MDVLMARYLDGTLTDTESAELLEALATDPRLEAEMAAYEEMLSAAAHLPAPRAPATLTDDVMSRLAEELRPRIAEPRRRSNASLKLLATAATVVLIAALSYGIGRITPEKDRGPANLASVPASGLVTPVSLGDGGSASAGQLHLVRFAHAPSRSGVSTVSVAGSFNEWNPAATPMTREGHAWVTYLLLPGDWHEYMFVEDGDAWVTDPAASWTVNDGFGNENAVLDLSI
jgi:hypothetical protein